MKISRTERAFLRYEYTIASEREDRETVQDLKAALSSITNEA